MISKNLIKSSFIYTIIGSLPLISGFFLLLFYTNYLNTSLYGALVIYVSFTGLLQVLINLGLDAYISISYFDSRKNSDLFKSKISAITGYLLIWGLFITILFTLLGENLFSLIFQGKDIFFYPYGFMSVITAFCNSYFKTYSNLLINQEKPNRFAVVNFANFFMTIAFSLTGLFLFPETLIGPMWGRLLSGVGIFMIAFYSFNQESRVRFRLGDELKQALNFSIPVLIFFLFSWSISNIYPFILKYFMTLQDVAILGLVFQFTLLVEFVLNGMGSSISPKTFGMIKDQGLTGSTPELNKYFSGFNAFALIIIPASTFFIPLILPLIISKDYQASFLFLSVLNIGFISRGLYNYFLTPIYLFKKTSILPKMYLITAIIQIAISILFIKYFGIWGAIAANLITKIVQNVLLYLGARKIFVFRFSTMKFIWLPLIVTLGVIGSEYFVTSHNFNLLRLIQMVFTYILIYVFYKNEVRTLLKDFSAKYNFRRMKA